MKTITASELENNTTTLFEILLTDGEVTLTKNGQEFPLKLVRDQAGEAGTGLSRIVKAVSNLTANIPEEKREEVHDGMMTGLKKSKKKRSRI